MKKIFVEPEMKRFELDLSENIAASLIEYVIVSFTVGEYCFIVNTGLPVGTEVPREQIQNCITYIQQRKAGTMAIPIDQLRQFVR